MLLFTRYPNISSIHPPLVFYLENACRLYGYGEAEAVRYGWEWWLRSRRLQEMYKNSGASQGFRREAQHACTSEHTV